MSVFKFELKEDHLKLLEVLELRANEDKDTGRCGLPYVDNKAPFGDLLGADLEDDENESTIKDAAIVIYGDEDDRNEEEKDPFEDEGPQFTEEQLEYVRELVGGLYYAMDIVLKKRTFEPGVYKTKNYEIGWEKVD